MDAADHSVRIAATARIGADYRVEITTGSHTILSDEPGSLGGDDAGPDPFGLLYASLAACILITIRMYASRKGWPLDGAEIRILPMREPPGPLEAARIELILKGDALTPEQRTRIVDIAGKCPVHRTIERPVHIETVEIPAP